MQRMRVKSSDGRTSAAHVRSEDAQRNERCAHVVEERVLVDVDETLAEAVVRKQDEEDPIERIGNVQESELRNGKDDHGQQRRLT